MSAGTVLILDSNVDVLEIVKAMLTRASYDVLTVDSISAAWDVLRTRRVDLVMAEAVLPGASGAEFIRKVKEEFPSTAVMLMTAFSDEPLDPGIPVLEKPFSFSELAERVRRVLGRGVDEGPPFRPADRARPLFESQAAMPEPSEARGQAAAARRATILVAESDPVLRSELRRVLSLRGYSVLEAPDAAEALKFVRQHSPRIDALVVNVLIRTEELVKRLSAELPGIPIVFTTSDGTAEHVLSMVEQRLRKSGRN